MYYRKNSNSVEGDVRAVFDVKPQGWFGRMADAVMVPCMYLVSGTFHEAPQRTHVWNYRKMTQEEVMRPFSRKMVKVEGIKGEYEPDDVLFPFLHVPILFGWRNYVVLKPQAMSKTWFIGWVCEDDTGGISKIPLRGKVRMLIGPHEVEFFGIENGRQIKLLECGRGKIGNGGAYCKVPLL
ncbi:TPA: hypothetical protein DEP58_02190 [Patescibacteria group bacterium]|nr:MAG: hypothetical protein UU98_C0020G0007 [Parcubacteria group bacterium GW2011_GWD2_42_14]HCC05094.1 hypothetical protein [Patescibacteria group bacterium]